MPPAAPAGSTLARDRDIHREGAADRDRPPPSQLVGHENLFGYWHLGRWAKEALRAAQLGAAGSSLDALLQSAGLPLLSQTVATDGSGSAARAAADPNDSLLAMAFQAVGAPLPRHNHAQPSASASAPGSASGTVSGLSETQRRALSFSATSRDRGGVGPLQLSAQLDALVSHRAALLDAEGRQARREKKRRKREAAAAAAARPSPTVDIDVQAGQAAGAHPSPATGAPSAADGGEGDGRFKLTLSLAAVGKKRKAEGGTTPADKQKRKKQELVV